MKKVDSTNNRISRVQIDGDEYLRIENSDALRPFFMNVVSDGNHWMFVSSNCGISMGRRNAEYAFFPYYTDDKITESTEITGSKTIFQIQRTTKPYIWEPFSHRCQGKYQITRNLYKNTYGNKILYEEINHNLNLTFRYSWNSSGKFGFVRKSELINDGTGEVSVSLLDGLQNIVPYGVNPDLQNLVSNLVDAYKRSELVKQAGLGIYSLSAIIVDKAEPSEALKANIAWSTGLEDPQYLLSSRQLDQFRKGEGVQQETDVKGEKGAYFVHTDITLAGNGRQEWMILADVNKDHSDVAAILNSIHSEKELDKQVSQDVERGTKRLIELIGASDGLQHTSDQLKDTRHFSNTLFNVMRGGIFDLNYQIEKWDLKNYLLKANSRVHQKFSHQIDKLPDSFALCELKALVDQSEDAAFRRLCIEYLPLKFSRRHGDPSRPWNRFSINTRNADGSKLLDYEGNWRDIFQNWEALALAYPDFLESMIYKFLNATTFDGYNPYRVTKDGFEWETIEPDNPWSYIGYWGDHQVIYLLKLLESIEKHHPGKLESYFDREDFVYANIPYRIKSYAEILKDPKDTIEFDEELDFKINQLKKVIGADACLMQAEDQSIYTVNFIEKMLAVVLAKLSNFIPEGGIWMNTQRPEWNDANNALVGNGVSMVTLCYLRRFLYFFKDILARSGKERFKASNEMIVSYKRIRETLENHKELLSGAINDIDRKHILDEIGRAASDYRQHIYQRTFWGEKRSISKEGLGRFIEVSLKYIDHTIKSNERPDKLYHAYNLMTIESDKEVSISRLSEMLEGQVAVLSSGYLSAKQSLSVLDGLRNSALFRDDQYSYLLYPDKDLPGFMEKNTIRGDAVSKSSLLKQLLNDDNKAIIARDIQGACHFNGLLKNASDLVIALDQLPEKKYAKLVQTEQHLVLQIFEEVFNHKAFTGRSGTFFGYEGLGSIYWHMVSKLRLATQECTLEAIQQGECAEVIGKLLEHYYEISEGIGVHKPPLLYGAFPTDPYSHTPAGRGAQQPGMTGQVKEDVLCRFGELGVFVKDGRLYFNPCLLRSIEFMEEPGLFEFVNIHQEFEQIPLEKGMLGFTYCQVPVVYKIASSNGLEIVYKDQATTKLESLHLDHASSRHVFGRTGKIIRIEVHMEASQLK